MSIRALPLLCLVAASPVRAGTIELVPTCVAIDDSHDALTSLERAQASTIMTHVLEAQDLLVVDTGCVDTYTLAHERDGEQLTVHVHGPHGSRRLRIAGLGELPDAYRRIVTSLREAPVSQTTTASAAPAMGAPVDPSGIASTAPPAYSAYSASLEVPEPAAPPSVAGESDAPAPLQHTVFYAQLGVGGMGGADTLRSFSVGYRGERDALAFDLSVMWFGSDSAGTQPASGARLAGKLLRELMPDKASSVYLGGGLAIGGATIETGVTHAYTGAGLEGIATLGADLRRDRTGVRLFAQADLILPFYSMEFDQTDSTEYSPSFIVSIGLGPGVGR